LITAVALSLYHIIVLEAITQNSFQFKHIQVEASTADVYTCVKVFQEYVYFLTRVLCTKVYRYVQSVAILQIDGDDATEIIPQPVGTVQDTVASCVLLFVQSFHEKA